MINLIIDIKNNSKKLDKQTTKLAKSLSISKEQASGIRQEFTQYARTNESSFITTNKLIQNKPMKITTSNLILALPQIALQKISYLNKDQNITNMINSVISAPLYRIYARYPLNKNGSVWFANLPKIVTNQSIKYMHKGLSEIEKVVNQNVRLKQEMNISNDNYYKSSKEALYKMAERLNRVSKQLKELAS